MNFIERDMAFIKNTKQGFINRICKNVYLKWDGNLEDIVKNEKLFFEEMMQFVNGCHELVEHSIPLILYRDLKSYSAIDWNFTEEQYKEEIERSESACHLYYNTVD